jgi:trans-2,3-dihydro-3-hydroxyanthranilate isomerase
MTELRFLHYDVFTDRRFEGNQLAVFVDGRGIDDKTMQVIAKEMNFSESTFILPKEHPDTDTRMRIFTPGSELPMAGHPTIGSTFALAHERVIQTGRGRFVFGLGVGPTPVEMTWKGGELDFAWMDQGLPDVRTPPVSAEELTRAAGISHDEFARTRLPIEEISCGNPFIFLPVATRAAVDNAEPDVAGLKRLRSAFARDHVGVFIFTTEGASDPPSPGFGEASYTVYSRMFAPGFGITEDPTTGSASGPLGCYLVSHDLVPDNRAGRIVSLQGVAMGRPSRLHIAIKRDESARITRVQVGGKAVLVGEGKLRL